MGLVKQGSVFVGVLFLCTLFLCCAADVQYYELFMREANFTKLCNTTTLFVANDSYPGPEIRAYSGDTVFVNVHNQGNYSFTIHWHGVKQPRNPWSDGPEFITQCPIQPGANFTYEQWRIYLGAGDYKQIIDQALSRGLIPRQPDAYAINGHLGNTTGCPNDTLFRMQVQYGRMYLLYIINVAMNEEKFFAIMNHSLTVVARDASYVQRFTSDYILISPGQTMDVLVVANQNVGQYYMATRPYSGNAFSPVDFITSGVFEYINSEGGLNASFIMLPAENDVNAANNFNIQIRNTNVTQNPPLNVPGMGISTHGCTLQSPQTPCRATPHGVL